jgi:hypothetical protein
VGEKSKGYDNNNPPSDMWKRKVGDNVVLARLGGINVTNAINPVVLPRRPNESPTSPAVFFFPIGPAAAAAAARILQSLQPPFATRRPIDAERVFRRVLTMMVIWIRPLHLHNDDTTHLVDTPIISQYRISPHHLWPHAAHISGHHEQSKETATPTP